MLIRFLDHFFFSLINLFMIINIQLFLVYEAGEGVSYIYLMNNMLFSLLLNWEFSLARSKQYGMLKRG